MIWLKQPHLPGPGAAITVNVCVGLSSEQETATAGYIGLNKFIREILIEISPFHEETSKKNLEKFPIYIRNVS